MRGVLLFLVGVTVVRESKGVSLPSDSTSASYDPDDDGLGFEERNDLEALYPQQYRSDGGYSDDFRTARKRSTPDALTRRSSLDKNFMRFGRSDFFPSERCCKHRDPVGAVDAAGESDYAVLRVIRSSGEAPAGSGRSSDNFIRFGRRDYSNNFMRYGRDDKNNFMRFGRGDKENFMRFGRGDKDNFMRFGRGDKDNFMRFGRDDKDNFMRFGKGDKDNFMRFGRGDKENFMRFGRGDESHRYPPGKKRRDVDGIADIIYPFEKSKYYGYESKEKDGDVRSLSGRVGENGTEESRLSRTLWDDGEKEEKGSGERRIRRAAEVMPRGADPAPGSGPESLGDGDSSESRSGGYGKRSKARGAAFIPFG